MKTRREFLLQSGLVSAAALLTRTALVAQQVPAPASANQASPNPAVQPNPTLPDQLRKVAATETIKTTKLTDTIFLLQGVGGNVVCQTGPDGKLVIDSQISTGTPQLLDALAKLGPHPLHLLVNTHWHF